MVGGSTLAFKKERKKGFDLLGGGDGGLNEVILGLSFYKCVGARGAGMYKGRMFSDDDGLMEGGLSIVVALTGSDRKCHRWKRAK